MKYLILTLISFFSLTLLAQYHVNGSATQEDCNCYTLTPALNSQAGSVWNIHKIDLTESFDFHFTVYLGNNPGGADGIAFVLQPISTSVGVVGGGLGFQGVTPSVGVTLDTYENDTDNDPFYDHIAIQLNGDLNHASANNIAGPEYIIPNVANFADGQFHDMQVVWDANTQTLSTFIDGLLRVSATLDLVNDVFSGDPEVFWGFTGSTGGLNNNQRFCTQNYAEFTYEILSEQSLCGTGEVQFNDVSTSSSGIEAWLWDFGDETTSTEQNPTHIYTEPGNYTATLQVVGSDNCTSEAYEIPIVINEIPTFSFSATNLCEGDNTLFTFENLSEDATIASWSWDFGDGTQAGTEQNPEHQFAAHGEYTITVTAESEQGCSNSFTKTIEINRMPVVEFEADKPIGCAPHCVKFTDNSTSEDGQINSWLWNFGTVNQETSSQQNPKFCYPPISTGEQTFPITLTVTTDKGCENTVTYEDFIHVFAPVTASFTADPTESYVPDTEITFENNSNNQAESIWSFGDGTSPTNNNNESFTYNYPDDVGGIYEVVLVVTNGACADTAKTLITIVAPDPEYEIPNVFTPNNDGQNDVFKLLNVINVIKIDVVILNRWGNVVYESNEVNFEWNGKVKNVGEECSEGVYFYKISFTGLNNIETVESGYITITR